jgi:multidrug efflux pump subunit AcrB
MRACRLLLVLAACRHHAHVEGRDRDAPRIAVIVSDPGANPDEIERSIVMPIENAVADMKGLVHVRSHIEPGVARVELELERDVDPFGATSELQQRMPLRELPSHVMPPEIAHMPAPGAVLHYVLRSDVLPAAQLRALEDWTIYPALERVPGVAFVEGCGGAHERILVDVDPAALSATGLARRDVEAAVQSANVQLPGGGMAVRGGGIDRKALADMVIAQRAGTPVRLSDVARVVDDAVPARCRAFDEHGVVVTGTVRARDGADTDEVHEAVARALAEQRRTLPAGVTLELRRAASFAVDASTDQELATMREMLAKVPGVAHLVIEQGADVDTPLFATGVARVEVSPRETERAAIDALRARGLVVHDRDEVIVQLLGPDREQLAALAHKVAATLGASARGEVGTTTHSTLQVVPDRDRLAAFGLDEAEVSDAVRAASDDGVELGASYVGERRVSVVLRAGSLSTPLPALDVHGRNGNVPLLSIARLEKRQSLTELHREDRQRWLGVAASGDAEAIERAMANIAMPAGYRWRLVAGTVER